MIRKFISCFIFSKNIKLVCSDIVFRLNRSCSLHLTVNLKHNFFSDCNGFSGCRSSCITFLYGISLV